MTGNMRAVIDAIPAMINAKDTQSRYVLSISSLLTFIVSKIAVGIFAGGVVFGTLLPELQLDLGPIHLDAFWIGSILVIVLTGLYTALGGMRAVAQSVSYGVPMVLAAMGILGVGWYGRRNFRRS